MDFELFQWIVLGAFPAALSIFGIFSPYIMGERWERIIVEELNISSDRHGNKVYCVVYRYDKCKLKHRKTTDERNFNTLSVGKKYKALIKRTKILMLKHPSEYTI